MYENNYQITDKEITFRYERENISLVGSDEINSK